MSEESQLWSEEREMSVESHNSEERNSTQTPAGDREGLPRGYRMRADSHYVDQLDFPSTGNPVQAVPISKIESHHDFSQADLRPLIESIRSQGVVQPLLVRRQHARYLVVAGRKRLAVAQMLRLETVPCLVHDLTDAEAVAMAAAEHVSIGPAPRDKPPVPDPSAFQWEIADHFATIRTCADLLPPGVGALDRSALDLLKAHAWRAAGLLDALGLISGAPSVGRRGRALSHVVDEVIEGFGAESRLSGVVLRADSIDDRLWTRRNSDELRAGLCGALLATLPLVEDAVRPTVVVRTSKEGGALALEVTLQDARVESPLSDHFFDDDVTKARPGGYAAAMGALAVKAFVERHGGNATFEAVDDGSRLVMRLPL
jgi:hypothetical protein